MKERKTEYEIIFDAIDKVNAVGDYVITPNTPEMSLVILSEVFSELDEKYSENKIIEVLNEYYKPQNRNFNFLLHHPSTTWQKIFRLKRSKQLGTFDTVTWLNEKNVIDKKLLGR